jgi:hypothetical protein
VDGNHRSEDSGTLCCPTCGARQEWSDTCRRCRCDLVLLRRAREATRHSRHRCLRSLVAGRYPEALAAARQHHQYRPDREADRLLAVCLLMNRNWAEALGVARRVVSGDGAAAVGPLHDMPGEGFP